VDRLDYLLGEYHLTDLIDLFLSINQPSYKYVNHVRKYADRALAKSEHILGSYLHTTLGHKLQWVASITFVDQRIKSMVYILLVQDITLQYLDKIKYR